LSYPNSVILEIPKKSRCIITVTKRFKDHDKFWSCALNCLWLRTSFKAITSSKHQSTSNMYVTLLGYLSYRNVSFINATDKNIRKYDWVEVKQIVGFVDIGLIVDFCGFYLYLFLTCGFYLYLFLTCGFHLYMFLTFVVFICICSCFAVFEFYFIFLYLVLTSSWNFIFNAIKLLEILFVSSFINQFLKKFFYHICKTFQKWPIRTLYPINIVSCLEELGVPEWKSKVL
jgi:hypothetical protein